MYSKLKEERGTFSSRLRAVLWALLLVVGAQAVQAQNVTVTGVVIDDTGGPLPGATVTVQGSTRGVITDIDGKYSISVAPAEKLVFSFLGYETQTIAVGEKRIIDVEMKLRANELDDVTIVAFGTQKKESVVASITTINPSDLKLPTSNLTTAFAGQMAGMISFQSSGEPGADNADFFIRGVTTFGYNVDPLILVDNIEISKTELARIQPDDIESFSIMKDAAATALYGARGANGVILIRTKEGRVGKAKLVIRLENTISKPTREIELADPITYMKLHNEAIITRQLGDALYYSDDKIANTVPGVKSYIYPATDWRNELLKKQAMNQRINMNISGGSEVMRYYVAASLSQDNGILKVDSHNNFNNNIDLKIYTLRSNVNIDLTKTTELKVSLDGTFEDYTGPMSSGSDMYQYIMRSNPVLFPAMYPKDEEHKYVNHTMFGNYDDGSYFNPYAQMVRGYREYDKSTMGAQMELKQNFDFIIKGLSARALFNTKREATSGISRSYQPYYYALLSNYNKYTGEYHVAILNPDANGETLSSSYQMPAVVKTTYFESSVNYAHKFQDVHSLNAQLVFTLRSQTIPATANDAFSVMGSLPYRNVNFAGRLLYSYNDRYMLEGNFGYNGSERFSAEHRWGFFPSVGLGWVASNEEFFEPCRDVVSMLKLRASYGLAGNDKISDDRFLYLSDVSLNSGTTAYAFGYEQNGYTRPGISISRYADPDITWEISTKANYAVELTLLEDMELVAEYYTEHRRNILQTRATVPYSMGLWTTPQANLGEAKSHGTDMSLTYNHSFNKDIWMQARANFTYATSKYTVYEEYDYQTEWWKYHTGNSTTQQYGYIAEGLFIDDAEVANSPVQDGTVMAGDLKFRDLNGDGVISDRDEAPIGYPTTPEIQYGFGSSFGYKSWDLSFFFNGLHRRSFWMDYQNVSPFFQTITGGHNALAKFIADSHWSESDRNPYAVWPRLAGYYSQASHNNVRNTWFMRDGAFLRLKSLEVGYTLPKELTQKARIANLRIYLVGTNLLCFSKFKLWDPEMGANGLGYPIQKGYNIGLNITF
ncbi:MAG: TonB-dependent receptor [Bacteroidales bacterium]|nr:TonB-dependent receptor [Bacteroidales bacterium]